MKTQGKRQSDIAISRDKAIKALQLRKLGWSYEDIAREVGYSARGIAWNAVNRLLSKQEAESADDMRQVEGERLNDMQRSFMLRAMKGETESAVIVLRIMQARARLFGLNKQVETQINIFGSPEWQQAWELVFSELDAPNQQKVLLRLEDERAKRRGA